MRIAIAIDPSCDATTKNTRQLSRVLGKLGIKAMPVNPIRSRIPRRTEIDALILPGGDDIPIELGGLPGGTPASIEYIESCMDWLAVAIRQGIPVLGMCLGLQIMNAACGGTLRNVPDHDGRPHRLNWNPRLKRILGPAMTGWVNSFHHQGIDRIGKGLVPLAASEDGLVEAAIIPNDRVLLVGVQWHPEWMHGYEMIKWFADQTAIGKSASPFAGLAAC